MRTLIFKSTGLGKILEVNHFIFTIILVLLILPKQLSAHCDSYDGPLIKDAIEALEKNDVNIVLKWVDGQHENEIADLFKKTVELRGYDIKIYSIVEKHFLETVVRLHREGEGASFTGLKPAGSASKIIVMADNAISQGDINDLSGKLVTHMEKELKEKFNNLIKASKTKDNSVSEGREYVKAYVEYTHYLEALHDFINGSSHHEEH